MNDPRPSRHLHRDELNWFDYDSAQLADIAIRHFDDYPDLATHLRSITRAAWSCDSYLAFEGHGRQRVEVTAVIWDEDQNDYAIDLDDRGNPLGVEFLWRTCTSA